MSKLYLVKKSGVYQHIKVDPKYATKYLEDALELGDWANPRYSFEEAKLESAWQELITEGNTQLGDYNFTLVKEEE